MVWLFDGLLHVLGNIDFYEVDCWLVGNSKDAILTESTARLPWCNHSELTRLEHDAAHDAKNFPFIILKEGYSWLKVTFPLLCCNSAIEYHVASCQKFWLVRYPSQGIHPLIKGPCLYCPGSALRILPFMLTRWMQTTCFVFVFSLINL